MGTVIEGGIAIETDKLLERLLGPSVKSIRARERERCARFAETTAAELERAGMAQSEVLIAAEVARAIAACLRALTDEPRVGGGKLLMGRSTVNDLRREGAPT